MNNLKKIFNLKPDISGLDTGLINWYNSVINKTYNQLDATDVSKMYRQNLLPDLAIERAVELVLLNPYDGEYTDGGLIELISQIDLAQINHEKIVKLKSLLKKVLENYEAYDWSTEEEMIHFSKNIKLLSDKLKKIG